MRPNGGNYHDDGDGKNESMSNMTMKRWYQVTLYRRFENEARLSPVSVQRVKAKDETDAIDLAGQLPFTPPWTFGQAELID